MSSQFQQWHDDYQEIIKKSLIQCIWDRIDRHVAFLEKIDSQLKAIKDLEIESPASLLPLSNYKKSLLKVTSELPNLCFKSITDEFDLFEKESKSYITSLPKKVIEAQNEDRFKKLKGDSFFIGFGKTSKRLGYNISKFPEKTANTLRGLRGKQKKALRPWTHDIFVSDLATYYLNEKFKSSLEELIALYYQFMLQSTIALWAKDEQVDKAVANQYEHLVSTSASQSFVENADFDVKELKTKIEELVIDNFEDRWLEFANKYEQAGTFEFANSKVNATNSKIISNKTAKKYVASNKGWINTANALQDDWEIDLELYHLIYSSLHLFYKNKGRISEKLESKVFKELSDIEIFLKNCKEAIESSTTEKKVQLHLENETASITAEIRRLVNVNSDKILNQELSEDIDRVENKISKEVNKISTKRVVYKGNDYTKPLKTSSLSTISPYELINFEYAPRLFKSINETKQSTTAHINEAQNILFQLTEIVNFNLESAISAIDEKDDQKGKTIAITGLDRTIEQLDNIKEELGKILTDLDEKLLKPIYSFNSSIVKFTDNENILELRVRVMKAKATERSKQIRRQVIDTIKNMFPILIRRGRMYINQARELVRGNLERLGIGAQKISITTELADFLAQTEEAIDKLPFVYQRLFRAVPLEDENFFEGRAKEINKLKDAYEQWSKKRFAATIIVGEKGGGISSLFNIFLQQPEIKLKSVRITPQNNIDNSEQLLELFNSSLGLKAVSLAELVSKLKSGKPMILILENIQRLYLKHVGGFDNIKSITELISVTSDKVFWMVGCTEFGYEYLNKTINLSENFGYSIALDSLSSTAIVELIERRHNVSGYKLEFQPSEEDSGSKKFASLPMEGKQEFLKKEFFLELNKIAKSNISIALIYWLRSTVQSSDNTIFIRSLNDLDFSFMKGLSVDKLYVLHMLLLHDGLTEMEVSRVNSLSISQCRRILYPLYEDGILIKKDDVYLINPLLYRQSINLLKTKNIIH